MTAKEIRGTAKRYGELLRNCTAVDSMIANLCAQQLEMLIEIAAQLAEINAKIRKEVQS
jgi:hypothetical protein